MRMVLKSVSVADLPKLNSLLDEMNEVKQKIEEISRGDHKELTEDSIEESLIEMTKSMDLDIDDLESELFESAKSDEQIGVTTLLAIPDELRKTAKAVLKLGEASVEEISSETKRSAEMESSFATTLVHMGYLAEQKRDDESYFMTSFGRRKKTLPQDVYDTIERNTTDVEKAILVMEYGLLWVK